MFAPRLPREQAYDARVRITALLVVAGLGTAHANSPSDAEILRIERDVSIRPQLQLDGGLSVAGAGYEHPISGHVALQAETFVFGTYFLPWFDRGDEVRGFGGGLRVSYFPRDDGRGLYITPYLRAARVAGTGPSDTKGGGVAVEPGAFVGYAFRLSPRFDLRVGGGVQYIYIDGDDGLRARTPFIALDAVLGFRL
jgi:hypothetical protein